jgi:hypothetical protein
MSLEKEIEKAMKLAFKKAMPFIIIEGVVSSVDKEKFTCEVTREGLPELKDVRLNAMLEPGSDIVTIFPKSGSKVLCAIIENDPTDAFLLSATDIEEFSGAIGETTFKISGTGIEFNDGEIGGLVKASELKTQLDKNTARIDGIIDALKNGITVPQDGGANYKTTITAALNLITEKENYASIENDKVKH